MFFNERSAGFPVIAPGGAVQDHLWLRFDSAFIGDLALLSSHAKISTGFFIPTINRNLTSRTVAGFSLTGAPSCPQMPHMQIKIRAADAVSKLKRLMKRGPQSGSQVVTGLIRRAKCRR